ncbi:unnamed protein product [Eruca vesicaria subsp. sativa]|uniref:Remorin C-terminal domain-containing protein n=1 Tax=Eruca vesicaria subsp. sativa TaxID=29727 RepID=A0ABC8LEX5_ERUVS|nr:unnamed protein product [Eruca vesicaria subsp. sativa]
MDITRNNITRLHIQSQSLFPPNMEKTLDIEPRMSTNPFADSLTSRINLKEKAEYIKSLPVSSNQSSSSSSEIINERRQSFSSQKSIGDGRSSGQRRVMLMESPCTPGRGVFSFSSNVSGRRRNFPSKWDDAEKWVTSGHESPAHTLKVFYSREEEEEEISKSLRHIDMESELRRSVSESKAALWDGEDDKIKFCQRYQREEAKIQAWVNLQNAKAEAQSRKLEVKIQRMRSNFEEKLMKRMDTVHRRAEDWRATARQQHAEQLQRAAETARKLTNRRGYLVSGRSSCGCLPFNDTCH